MSLASLDPYQTVFFFKMFLHETSAQSKEQVDKNKIKIFIPNSYAEDSSFFPCKDGSGRSAFLLSGVFWAGAASTA